MDPQPRKKDYRTNSQEYRLQNVDKNFGMIICQALFYRWQEMRVTLSYLAKMAVFMYIAMQVEGKQ